MCTAVASPEPEPPHRSPPELSDEVRTVLLSFAPHQFLKPPPSKSSTPWTPQTPGVLDLFSGSGRAAKSNLLAGFAWVLCFDVLRDPDTQDLTKPGLQTKILWLISRGAFLLVCGGPPCSSFSICITPPIRNSAHPAGGPWASPQMQQKIRVGNQLSTFAARCVAAIAPIGHYWIENPRSSWLWKQRVWLRLAGSRASGFWVVDYCRFGMKSKKPTAFLTNLQPLLHQNTRCHCEALHLRLRGNAPFGIPWTKICGTVPLRYR